MITKTREASRNVYREAIKTPFTTKPGTDVTGVRGIGGPSVDAFIAGYGFPNVQDAIDEVKALTNFPINGLYFSTENKSPAGVRQAETLTFDGVVTGAGTDAVVVIYGITFIVPVGTTADAMCDIVKAKFEEMRDANVLFATVNRLVGVTPVLEVQFIDTTTHLNIENFVGSGITVSRAVTVQGEPGFGTWDFLGTETKTLAGGSAVDPFDIYVFKRIG